HGKEIQCTLHKVRSHISTIGEEKCVAIDEVGRVRELDEADVMAKRSVIVHLPAFKTKFEGVFAAHIRDGIAQHRGEIAASLRKSRHSAEVQTGRLDIYFRQANRTAAGVVNSELRWIIFVDCIEGDVNAVEAQTKLVNNSGT